MEHLGASIVALSFCYLAVGVTRAVAKETPEDTSVVAIVSCFMAVFGFLGFILLPKVPV